MSQEDLGPLPRSHPRAAKVASARKKLLDVVDAWMQEFGLTRAEEAMLLADYLTGRMESAVACERRER